jgi:TPR repeat protein
VVGDPAPTTPPVLGVGDAAAERTLAVAESAIQQGDYGTALKELTRLGEAGDAQAQRRLGNLYQVGEGVTRDLPAAAAWYAKAAEQGDAEAQYNLANMYLMGEGVEQDDAKALSWYRKAAAQGHAAAQQNLESLSRTGSGAPIYGAPAATGHGETDVPLY